MKANFRVYFMNTSSGDQISKRNTKAQERYTKRKMKERDITGNSEERKIQKEDRKWREDTWGQREREKKRERGRERERE